MRKPTALDRHVVVIDHDDSIKAAQQSDRHLRKIIIPHVKPEYGEVELEAEGTVAIWTNETNGHRPVVESQEIQLSWADVKAPQKPHWHQFQLESYSSLRQMELVFRSVDDARAEFKRIQFTGRVLIPPRVCHYVRLSGPTEVLQIRSAKTPDRIDLEQDQTVCSGCFLSDSCSEELALKVMN